VQARLLDHAITLTKPGGLVVFSNCSLDPIEGEEMVSVLLARRDDVVADPISPNEFPGLAPFVDGSGRLRTTPADLDFGRPELAGLDGFFAARLRKTAR
jgi:16S rRNA (cytosine967-C5)-methyltransferase